MARDNEKNQKSKKVEKPLNYPKKSHAKELVDHYWESMGNVNNLIKSSNLKTGIILSFYCIPLSFIYQSSQGLVGNLGRDAVLIVPEILWFVMTTVSIFYCTRCFIPKIEGNYDNNVFFFGDVISKFGNIKQSAQTFYEMNLNKKAFFQQLGEQMFILPKIAGSKYRNVILTILFLALSPGLLLITSTYHTVTTFL